MRKILLAGASLVALAVATPAIAADLRPMATKAPPMAAYVPFSWSGFYFGVNAGYGFGDAEVETRGIDAVNIGNVTAGFRPGRVDLESEGFLGGVQIGYNWQVSNVVFGLEADIQYTDFNDTRNVVGTSGLNNFFSHDINYLGTFRGKLGLAFDRTLLYITGGLAYGGVENTVDFRSAVNTTAFFGRYDDTRVGYTIGAGLEYAFTNNISLKAEYLYYDLGDTDVTVALQPGFAAALGAGYVSNFRNDGHIVRGGINFRFGGPAAPVMARY